MRKQKLTPYEIVTGRPVPLMIESHVSPVLINSEMTQYCKALMQYAKVYFHQVKESFCGPPADGRTFHNLEPGE